MEKRQSKRKGDMRGRTEGARRNQFKKGTSGNTYKLPEGVKEVRKLIKSEFMVLANKYFFAGIDSLKANEVKKIKGLTNAELGMISIWRKIVAGDEKKLEWFLSRTIGKVKEELDITSQDSALSQQSFFNLSNIGTAELKTIYKILLNAQSDTDA